MTIEEKRNAIDEYCCSKYLCSAGEYPCPLRDLTEDCVSESDEIVERNFDLVSKMPDYHGQKEEKSCCNCKFTDREVDEEPCTNCKNDFVVGTKEYDEHDLLWQSMDSVGEETKPNNVDHPSHYNNGGMECIDEMILVFGKSAVMNFCVCNAWKYRYRANAKNGQEDLDKANWYMAKYKELQEGFCK